MDYHISEMVINMNFVRF